MSPRPYVSFTPSRIVQLHLNRPLVVSPLAVLRLGRDQLKGTFCNPSRAADDGLSIRSKGLTFGLIQCTGLEHLLSSRLSLSFLLLMNGINLLIACCTVPARRQFVAVPVPIYQELEVIFGDAVKMATHNR